jgi:NAD(P)H-flavin reductase
VNPDLDSYKKVLLMLSERPEELSEQFFIDNIYTAEKLQRDEVGAKILRQIRHEDGKKVKRSICGSLDMMNQYQKDLNEKDKRMRRAARRERHEAKKKLMNRQEPEKDFQIGDDLSKADRASRGQIYS